MISKGGRVDRAHMRRETSRLLERLGLHLNVDRLVGTLSLAEQQLVEVAKALAWQPDLLILDEATSALDVHQVETLFQIVRKLRDQGVTILFVSHRMYEITQLCNQALVLKDGVIMAQFGEEEIASITQAKLVEAMVGKTVSAMYPEKSHMHAAGALLQIEDLSTNLLKHVHMAVRRARLWGWAACGAMDRRNCCVPYSACPPAGSADRYCWIKNRICRARRARLLPGGSPMCRRTGKPKGSPSAWMWKSI